MEEDPEKQEELSTDELVQITEDKVDALINLLVEKKIISEQEFSKALDDLYEDEPGETPPE